VTLASIGNGHWLAPGPAAAYLAMLAGELAQRLTNREDPP